MNISEVLTIRLGFTLTTFCNYKLIKCFIKWRRAESALQTHFTTNCQTADLQNKSTGVSDRSSLGVSVSRWTAPAWRRWATNTPSLPWKTLPTWSTWKWLNPTVSSWTTASLRPTSPTVSPNTHTCDRNLTTKVCFCVCTELKKETFWCFNAAVAFQFVLEFRLPETVGKSIVENFRGLFILNCFPF